MQHFIISITETTPAENGSGSKPIEHYRRLVYSDGIENVISRVDEALSIKSKRRRLNAEKLKQAAPEMLPKC